MKKWPDLKNVLGDVPWAAVGGVATRCYMPERSTVDLDIVIEKTDSLKVRELLRTSGYEYLQELSVRGSAWLSPEGIEIDVLESDEPWMHDALSEAQNNRDLQGLPVIPFHFFVLMKFRSGRMQDLADITRMLGLASEERIKRVRRIFEEMERDSLEDLEHLILLGKMEMGKQEG